MNDFRKDNYPIPEKVQTFVEVDKTDPIGYITERKFAFEQAMEIGKANGASIKGVIIIAETIAKYIINGEQPE